MKLYSALYVGTSMRHTKTKNILAGSAILIGSLPLSYNSARAEIILEEDVAIAVGNITEIRDGSIVISTGDKTAIISF